MKKWDFSITFLPNLHSSATYLFKEIAGKSENVEEGGISERRCDLPMFGQGMRRVRLSGVKTARVKKLHHDTDGEGRLRRKLRTRQQPTWLISLVSWDKMVTPMMQCSTLSCERKYHINGPVAQARLQKAEAALLRRGSSAYAPVESAWRQRWHFWTRSRPSDSRTSPVWWSGRTAGSKPGSRTLLTLAA